MNEIAERLGVVGLPEPVRSLAARRWDVIVVGGGHNGLTCAAYLARAGKSVLVLEARERLGGAATLDRPFPDPRYVVSPCAYVVGLLDETVIRDLRLHERGLEVYLADPQLWVPFDDGTAFAQWLDHDRTLAGLRDLGFSQKDIDGYFAYEDLFDQIRIRLRKGARDTWSGDSPSRAELEELLGGERLMTDVLFHASIAEVLDEFVGDQRLKDALFGQGIIGTYAGPKDPGTAAVKFMHFAGEVNGEGAVWGYVRGGMGVVSFAIADAAREAGAVLATGVPVGEVLPGEGVRLEDGTFIAAATIVSNADPKRLMTMLPGDAVPQDYRRRIEDWDIRSPVVKFNAALSRLPDWTAAPGETFMARGVVNTTTGLEDAQKAFERCETGEPAVGFGEIYVQTGHDPSPAPEGRHLMSVFGQYASYDLNGGWDNRREDVAKQFIDLIERFAPGFSDCLESYEVLGAPDIERRVGLTGGHIFQGEVRPNQMWTNRLTPRTPIPHLYLCGAATHPGGSVIALNGKNAAIAILADQQRHHG
ncbi:phytoene desaturase family protein [Sphaerisporangium corydalis]|uniref:Pyridine nucleotide-disulfide oxidoreductase domain-containing protein 2 n=1 Tax=Sphaerisporangium corydalis TaxID=1441875 RepID=A0ABV9EE05_9ACTN|nr:NAD(P)/FAD-dependent oxidoreductase [Sphaerisporangium corydalis]